VLVSVIRLFAMHREGSHGYQAEKPLGIAPVNWLDCVRREN
jgi:hypothetical protein